MKKIYNLISTFKAQTSEKGGVKIRGMASTSAMDRIGDVIAPEAWSKGGLDNFKKNPIILFNHNYDRPIGKATGLDVTELGLEIEAEISAAAEGNVAELIKDGVLGTFSVGFMIRDADYIEETGGLKIKDAELFETSVVSVPMNQDATFSLAKSFDSMEEYEDFKKTFTNSADLAGQKLAKIEENSSGIARLTPDGASSNAQKEIKMDEERKLELEAIAKKAAEDTAAKFAMDQAKKVAAEEAVNKKAAEVAAEEAAREAAVQTAIETGVSGAEKLVSDMEEKFTARDADIEEVMKTFRTEVAEAAEELTKLQNSKRMFVDRGGNMSMAETVKANKDQFIQASLLGTITGKGWDTDFGKDVITKAGMNYVDSTTTGDLDQEVRDLIQKEIWVQTKVASLFREISVNGRATVLPLQSDVGYAAWGINQGYDPTAHGTLENRPEITDAQYDAQSRTMLVARMISATYIDNDVEEMTLVNLLPMLFEGVARAHARKVEAAIMFPSATGGVNAAVDDIEANAAASTITVSIADPGVATASDLMLARGKMGRYGLNPADLAYIVSQECYYNLISDPEFQNLNEVGDIATKLRGVIGGIFGSPVIASEEFGARANLAEFAYVVNRNNYVIPRLRGITVETDYEVANQRKMIVASQSLGFTELWAGVTGHQPAVSVGWVT